MPIPLIVVGGVLLLFILLFSLRIRIQIRLRNEVCVTLRILCFSIRLFPKKKKLKWKRYSPKKAKRIAEREARKRAKKAARRAAKKAKKEQEKHLIAEGKKEKTTLSDKLILVRGLTAALIRKTGKKLKLTAARLHIRVATGDAAKTAILYGAVCQTLAYLLAGLDRVTKLKAEEPEVSVIADYLAERPSADVKLEFSVRVWGAFSILVSAALAYLKTTQRIKTAKKKKRKAAKAAGAKSAQKGAHNG